MDFQTLDAASGVWHLSGMTPEQAAQAAAAGVTVRQVKPGAVKELPGSGGFLDPSSFDLEASFRADWVGAGPLLDVPRDPPPAPGPEDPGYVGDPLDYVIRPTGGTAMALTNGVVTGQPADVQLTSYAPGVIDTPQGPAVDFAGIALIPIGWTAFAAWAAANASKLIALAKALRVPAVSGAVWAALTAMIGGSGADPGGTDPTTGILQGPGLPEPRAGTFKKSWFTKFHVKGAPDGYVYFWLMNDGYIVSYTTTTGATKRWKPEKPAAVLMSKSINLQQFVKADRLLDRIARRVAKRSSRLALQKRGR